MLEMNSSARQRKESKKSAKTAKQHSRNHSKKTKQRKQHHYFCSQKSVKGPKSKRKRSNGRKKIF